MFKHRIEIVHKHSDGCRDWLFTRTFFLKVGSHDPVLVQLSFQIFLCMMKNVGVCTIQFSDPITPITCSISIQYIKNVGNLSKIGIHTSNCCLEKWAEE